MSEPTWELLGGGGVVGGPIDYVGAWAAGTQYQPGQVVRYGGVDYLAVNPSLGQTPPASFPLAPSYGTTLPANPLDGQEAILVDSVTNPTYQWRFRYNAGSTSLYKWEFIGGPPHYQGLPDYTTTGVGAWQQMPGNFLLPRAGDWDAEGSAEVGGAASGHYLGMMLDGTASIRNPMTIASGVMSVTAPRRRMFGVGAGQSVQQGAYSIAAVATFASRWMSILPVRVS